MKITKAEEQKIKDFFYHHISNIRMIARLEDFYIGFQPSDDDDKDFKGSRPAMMTMQTDYEYLTSELRYNRDVILEAWKNKDYESILETLCHEIGHIVTSEPFDRLNIKYKGEGKYYNERLTERVGRLISRLYQRYCHDNDIDLRTAKVAKKNGKRKKR
jgi:hypothetical protein